MLGRVQALIRYHEIALKGRNRPFFVRRLARNLSRAASDLGRIEVRSLPGRLALSTDDSVPWDQLRERIEAVFGVANFSPVTQVARDLEQVKRSLVPALAERPERTFAVRSRRADKQFEMSSGEIERELGSAICLGTDLRVHLDAPEITVYVEVMKDRIYYCFDKIPGPGGMPVGTAGTVAALLSGGIDSPVAARRMMRRGCRVVFVHFHAFPLQDRTTIDKAMRLSDILTRYQYKSRLLLVPFGAVQQTIVAHTPAPLRVVLYRRFMVPHRRGAGAGAQSQGPHHRREPGTGRLSDSRQHVGHRRRFYPPDTPSARRNGQAGDHQGGGGLRNLRDQHAAGPGLLSALHASQPGHLRLPQGGRAGRGRPRRGRPRRNSRSRKPSVGASGFRAGRPTRSRNRHGPRCIITTPRERLGGLMDVRHRFREVVRRPDERIDLAEAALLIAGQEYPDLDVAAYLARFDEMGARLGQRVREDLEPIASVLGQFLFAELGFKGNEDNYYDPRNSFLNDVLDRRMGIPITLSTVCIEVARRAVCRSRVSGYRGTSSFRWTAPGARRSSTRSTAAPR